MEKVCDYASEDLNASDLYIKQVNTRYCYATKNYCVIRNVRLPKLLLRFLVLNSTLLYVSFSALLGGKK